MPASERAAYERAISGMGDPIRNYINLLYSPPPAPPPTPAPAPAPAAVPGSQPGAPISAIPGGGGGLIQNPGLGSYYDAGQSPYAPLPQFIPPSPLGGGGYGGGGGVAAEQAGMLDPDLSRRLRGVLQ
jgi:hypothetical protein